MNRVNALNIYFGNYRKYLLIVLNVVLVIFIILEVMIWNDRTNIMTEQEYLNRVIEICNSGKLKPVEQESFCRFR